MRALALTIPFLLLTACKDEPDFETRFDEASKEVEARAKSMDADVTATGAPANSAPAPAAPADGPAKASPNVLPGGKIPRVRPEPLPETVNPTNPPPSSGE